MDQDFEFMEFNRKSKARAGRNFKNSIFFMTTRNKFKYHFNLHENFPDLLVRSLCKDFMKLQNLPLV